MARVKLVELVDLERLLENGQPLDRALAEISIELVSAEALAISGREWKAPSEVPSALFPILALATHRLYTNPRRFRREADGQYSYGLDASVTGAEIFTAPERDRLRRFGTGAAVRQVGWGTVATTRGGGGLL